MTREVASWFYRPGVAATNLVSDPFSGGATAAVRALMDPEGLTPEESKTLADRWGVEGFAGGLLNAVTDPVVLFAALTAFRFPIPRAIQWVKEGGTGAWKAQNVWNAVKKIKGDENKLSTLMYPLRSAHSNFRGTNIPDIMDDIVASRLTTLEKYLPAFGDAIRKYETTVGRPLDLRTQVLAVAKLERLDQRAPRGFAKLFEGTGPLFKNLPTDKPFLNLVKDWEKVQDDIWTAMFSDPEAQKSIMQGLRAVSKFEGGAATTRAVLGKRAPRLPEFDEKDPVATAKALKEYFTKEVGYFPHYPTKDLTAMIKAIEEETRAGLVLERGLPGQREYSGFLTGQMLRQVTRSAYKRRGGMLPSVGDLSKVSEYVNPEALAKVQQKVGESAQAIMRAESPKVAEYSMRLMDSTSTYVHAAASMNAWTIKGNGTKMLEALHTMEESGQHLRAKLLKDTYIPALMGKMTYQQAKHMQVWSNKLTKWHDWLDGDMAKKWVPPKVRESLQKMMIDIRGVPTVAPLSRHVAGYLYLGALGGNLAAAARNLFQLVLTTGPVLGPKYTWKGIENAMAKTKKYIDLRYHKKHTHSQAFQKSFPEYFKAGIPRSPMVDETIGRTMSSAYDAYAVPQIPVDGGKIKKGVDATKDILMKMFSASEQTVRHVSFEGALLKGRADALADAASKGIKLSKEAVDDAVLSFARKTVAETQFLTGPTNIPAFFIDKNPLMRMFMMFPTRYLEYLSHVAWRIGGATPSGRRVPGLEGVFGAMEKKGINPGTFARAILWSEAAARLGYEAFSMDLDQSLIPGALPLPRNWGVLPPLPIMPPIVTVAGAPVLDIAEGDLTFEQTRRAAPLLMPGGVGAARMVGTLGAVASSKYGEVAAKAAARPYVDYSAPNEAGHFPAYTSQGSLIGFMSPAQIFLMGTGLGEGGQAFPTERHVYKFMLRNRERVREYKRGYVEAVISGNMQKAHKIDQDFQRAIPGAKGLRQWIGEDEFEAAEKRRMIPRLEKLLETMPPEVRPFYAQALQQALMEGAGAELLGYTDPEALTRASTIKQRAPYRRPAPKIQQKVWEPFQQHMGPLGTGRMPQHSVSYSPHRPSETAFSGFASLSF